MASGADVALAFAIAGACLAKERRLPPSAQSQEMFTCALAQLIRQALATDGGDPAFQAIVLQAQETAVHEHVQLRRARAADQRAVRTATNSIAHPGKLRRMPAGAVREALARLHALAAAGSWAALAQAVERALAQGLTEQPELRAPLEAMRSSPALTRLQRGDELLRLDAVRRYQALCERRGPLAGSHAAAAKGRTSAREGERAEQAAAAAFGKLAELLNRHREGAAGYRVVRSLRTPRGFPGTANKAKEEWDAALLHGEPGAAAELILLAEIKASPAAAMSDFPRLLRGLRRLAHASAETAYAFASADGEARFLGASLRQLEPVGHLLPSHVIYCCSATAEPPPQVLSAASKAVLLAEPASLAFALQVARGKSPPHSALAPVWNELQTAPRLRAALHQYETAAKARAAMLHPDDLVAAVERSLDQS
ncbi:hypothetical protein [Variovorax sp. Root318D1]|uniref:hypothetical protein n=1 Tax=Variovorax sp. Root318D1 TaxID=1736513 RepID=UPI001F271C1E|nr:hypothetical protein [Variovorax sp. Root318D1]